MSAAYARTMIAVFALMGVFAPMLRAADKVPGYDTFRLLKARNMFDPNRRPVRVEPPPSQRSAAGPQRPRSSSLALTGTMVTEGRSVAFFSGDRSDYNRVISVGDTVADCKVTAIKPREVEVERGGKTSVLAVGNRIQIEGATPDIAPEEPAPAPPGPPTEGPPAPGAPAPGTPGPDAPAPAATDAAPPAAKDVNDVLRRMMERREKEMSK
jgi:hypothetical protein